MFWIKKPLNYEILVPPLEKPVDQLSRAEARQYFDWYLSKLEDRTDYLRDVTGLPLDHSPASLVPLWKWFLRHAEIEKTPPARLAELEAQFAGSPLAATLLEENARQLSLQTEYMIRDIGMYWGQVFVKNHPGIHWDFYTTPKRDMFVNRPLLMGFPNEIFPEKEGVPFEPVHMAGVQASKLFRGNQSKYDLIRVHNIWAEKIKSGGSPRTEE